MAFAESFLSAFQQGSQIRRQKEQDEREEEERKFRIDVLKQQQKEIELEGRHRALTRSREGAKEAAGAMEGRPLADLIMPMMYGQMQPGQGGELPARPMPQMTKPSANPFDAQLSRAQVQVPGSQDLGIPGYSITPKSGEEQIAAAVDAMVREGQTKAMFTKHAPGEVTPALGPEPPAGERPQADPESGWSPQRLLLEAIRTGDKQLERAARQSIEAGRAPVQPRDERIVQVMGPNGTPIWVRESQAVGQPAAQAARAVTGQERQALAYFNRAKRATEDIEATDASGMSLEDRVAKAGIVQQGRLQYAPNWAQSPENQAYRQAQRAFTEARLRKESGAAIPTPEYENDAKTYFAQPGDDPATIDQKRKARSEVLDGLKFGAGKAYDEYYGSAPNTGTSGGNEFNWVNGQLVPVTK